MRIEMREIAVRDLFDGYLDSQENGVVAWHGRLDVRPAFQREFIYKPQQRDEVIRTVRKGFPLNVMYWSVSGHDEQGRTTYELMDGQQRTLSLCQFIQGDFSVDQCYFNGGLTDDERRQILDYRLTVYICEGTEREKLDWFKVINIAGLELAPQELRNAIYTGPWLSDAKRKFSKNNCVAWKIGEHYVSGELVRQAYLETALSWIADSEGVSVEEYMAAHQHDSDASELWNYYQTVIRWVETVFPTERSQKPRREMKGLKWGILYNQYAARRKTSLAEQVSRLMKDDEIEKRSGIYEYLLSGDERFLHLRSFRDSQKRAAYERQRGKCCKCGRRFPIEEMEADHITPWSKGGTTTDDNCQMLCKRCNRIKSDI